MDKHTNRARLSSMPMVLMCICRITIIRLVRTARKVSFSCPHDWPFKHLPNMRYRSLQWVIRLSIRSIESVKSVADKRRKTKIAV